MVTSAACACALLSAGVKGAIRGKLQADVFAARNKHLAQVITLPVGLLFPSRGRRTHRSAALSLLAVAGVKDHNIISRQEGTRWWNMHEAEGHRTGVNIYTSAASQNDWLPQRTCCEKSIQLSGPLLSPLPAFKTQPTSLCVLVPGVFKMYNHYNTTGGWPSLWFLSIVDQNSFYWYFCCCVMNVNLFSMTLV